MMSKKKSHGPNREQTRATSQKKKTAWPRVATRVATRATRVAILKNDYAATRLRGTALIHMIRSA